MEELGGMRIDSIAIYPAPPRSSVTAADRPLTLRSRFLQDGELAFRTVAALLKARKHFAVLHAQQPHLQSVAAVFASRVLGKRSVLTLHLRVPGSAHPLRRWVDAIVKRLSLSLPSEVVAVSPFVAESFGRPDIEVVENGVDVRVFHPSATARERIREGLGLQDELVYVFSGRWSRHKGVDLLVRAMESWALRDRKCRVLILGDRATDEPDLSRDLGNPMNDNRLIVVGLVDDVAAYLAAGDVFVLPSRFEGMPLSLLEAMATGLPVLASDIPVHRMLVERSGCGWMFRSGDAEDLARVMAEILDQGVPAGWTQRARDAAIRYNSLELSASKYVDLYARILSAA